MKKLLPALIFLLIFGFEFLASQEAKNNIEASFSNNQKVFSLAGSWDVTLQSGEVKKINLPSSNHIRGKFNYEREFSFPINSRKIYFLKIEGVNYKCDVFVNEKFIGSAEGYYTNEILKIPENLLLNSTNNKIKFIIWNEFNEQTIPEHNLYNSIQNFNGITKKIEIIEKDLIWISNVEVEVVNLREDKADLLLNVKIDKSKNIGKIKSELVLEIADTSGLKLNQSAIQFNAGDTLLQLKTTLQHPKHWSTNFPNRYKFNLILKNTSGEEVLNDETSFLYGIKKFEIGEKNFLLNFRPLIIKGILYNPLSNNSDFNLSIEKLRADLKWIKDAGFNAIETKYIEPSDKLIELCEEFGLLMLHTLPLSDVPANYFTNQYSENFSSYLNSKFTELYKKRISLLMIGPGVNFENFNFNEKLNIDLQNKIALILYGNEKSSSTIPKIVYFSNKNIENLNDEILKLKAENGYPTLIAGIGYNGEWGNHEGFASKNSEEFQAKNLENVLNVLIKQKVSFIINSYSDYKMEFPTTLSPSDKINYNLTGLVTEEKNEKMGAHVIKSIFMHQATPNLFKGSATNSAELFYTITSVIGLILSAWIFTFNMRIYKSLNRALFHLKNYLDDIINGEFTSFTHSIIILLILTFPIAILISSVLNFVVGLESFDRFFNIGSGSIEWRSSAILIYQNVLSLFFKTWLQVLGYTIFTSVLGFLSYRILGSRIPFTKLFIINSWLRTPSIYLLLFATFLPKLYSSSIYIYLTLFLIVFTLLWSELRILRSISILSEKPIFKVFQVYSFFGALILTSYYFYNPLIFETLNRTFHYFVNIFPYF